MSTSILSQNTSTDNYLIANNIDSTPLSTITTDGELITTPFYSADNNDALLFSTELSITEDETSLSTLTAGSTTSAYDVTTAEIPTPRTLSGEFCSTWRSVAVTANTQEMTNDIERNVFLSRDPSNDLTQVVLMSC
ncbi:hypothetical protein J6590_093702 [Homalodisca vitripennis]|nr:hypothetical protein J6590_054834 [Homalodisca vitripennis]KAG8289962.1 hypothetical protein J6590_093702 [Homalodisca vitripennis]